MPAPLSEHQLAVIQRCLDEGMSYRQAGAAAGGVTKSGVYKRVRQARREQGPNARLVTKEQEVANLPRAVLFGLLGSPIERIRTEAAAALAGIPTEMLEERLQRSAEAEAAA